MMTHMLILAVSASLLLTMQARAQDSGGTTPSETTGAVSITSPAESTDAGSSPSLFVTEESSSADTPSTTSQAAAIPTTPMSENATDSHSATTTSAQNDAGTSVTTPEGVIYQVLRPGTGPLESSTHTLLLHYTLFRPDGQKVESSRDAEFPVPLKLKRNTNSFIKGFEIGTQGMRVGEIRRIFIPSELGYGEKGNEVIPPNTPLIFETELVDLK